MAAHKTVRRIAVVGSTCSGKTTLARQLAAGLRCPHVELDALHWEPNWTPAPEETFRARVTQALAGEWWVADGNYSAVRDLIWSQAEMLVWLDYGLPLLLWRVLRRSVRRILTREALWNGNRERWEALSLANRDSLLRWLLRTHQRRRRLYAELLASPEYAHLAVVRLRSPSAVREWLARSGIIDPAAAILEGA